MSHLRLVCHASKPSALERDLEESVRLVNLARAGATFVRPAALPAEITCAEVHAQLESRPDAVRVVLTDLGWEALEECR